MHDTLMIRKRYYPLIRVREQIFDINKWQSLILPGMYVYVSM